MTMFEGPCVGGPLDRQVTQSRFPKGFILVDKPARIVWFYDWINDAGFFCRGEPVALDDGKRYTTAERFDYDVQAVR